MPAAGKLRVHEWGAVIAYISLLLTITLYTQVYVPWIYPAAKEDSHWLVDPFIDVYITGAVNHPGKYRISRDSTRGDLLTDADPFELADLSRIRTSVKLKQGELIEIPLIKTITVFVSGEVVENQEITVPKGTKVFEIMQQIALSKEADPSPLKRKRVLKDGETLIIKKKKS